MTIRIDADDLVRKIKTLSELKELSKAVSAAAYHVKGVISKYPEGNQHRSVDTSLWTKKQRGYFFWALKNGKIQVPYKRTRFLSDRWTVRKSNRGLTATIGNKASYGPLVQGGKQTGYHATTGWNTTDKVIDQERGAVINFILQMLRKIVG